MLKLIREINLFLEMSSNKYIFKKYSKDYPYLFKREKYKLKKIFPRAKIEHIGSTSVKWLCGKGIIDIALSTSKAWQEKVIKKLQKAGYDYRPLAGDKERRFFQLIVKYGKRERRIHVHLINKDSNTWRAAIALRDYLKKHKKEAWEYMQVKRRAVKYAHGEGKRYREYKNPYLNKLVKKALKEDLV